MEEDTVELINYLRVIWKRKIIIFVGTLICMAVGVVTNLRLPDTYRAAAVVKIGKKASPSSLSSLSLSPLDTSGNLIKTIPIEYRLSNGHRLKVESFSGASMLRIVVEGLDRGVKESLSDVVNKLTEEHLRVIEKAMRPYKMLVNKLDTNASTIQNEIVESKAILQEIQTKGLEHDGVAMIHDRILQASSDLRVTDQEVLKYQAFIDYMNEDGFKTRLVGKVSMTTIKPNKKRNLLLAISVGFVATVFLVFFMEYIVMARTKQKGEEA